MRVALITAVLVLGCSNKSETKSESATETKPTPEDKAGERAAQPPTPPPAAAPAPPPAEAPKVDCAELVTPADVAKACGGSNVSVAVNSMEGKSPSLGVCSRALTKPSHKFPIAQVQLNVFPDVAQAEGWVKLEKTENAKELAGLGDVAWTSMRETKQLKSTDYSVGVRKGPIILKLSTTKNSLNEKPPCTADQLAELAKLILPRIP